MSGKRKKSGMIKLLKFEGEDGLDPRALFEGARLNVRGSVFRKSLFNDRLV